MLSISVKGRMWKNEEGKRNGVSRWFDAKNERRRRVGLMKGQPWVDYVLDDETISYGHGDLDVEVGLNYISWNKSHIAQYDKGKRRSMLYILALILR